MIPHACICRDCGALCALEGWTDRGGLCARCAFPVRRLFVNGVEVVGEVKIRETLSTLERLPCGVIDVTRVDDTRRRYFDVARRVEFFESNPTEDRDPIRDAIDRAAARWARDNPEDLQ